MNTKFNTKADIWSLDAFCMNYLQEIIYFHRLLQMIIMREIDYND